MPFFLLFVIVPVIEIAVLIKVGSTIGIFWTLLLILSTAVIGVNILRQQGMEVLMRASQKLNEGAIPAQELAEGFLLALAGALLLTPGFVTDACGFALLVPVVRQTLVGSVVRLLKTKVVAGAGTDPFASRDVFGADRRDQSVSSRRPDVIDGEFRRED